MLLPSLEHLAYPNDGGDHPGGGHCAGLGGTGSAENRIALVDQYINALDVLIEAALASGNGWSLSRPILFTVHQLCEIALDLAVHRAGQKTKKSERHSLEERFKAALDGGA